MSTVIVDKHVYDVSKFIANHPGENISKGRSINNYIRADITLLFSHIHDSKASRAGAREILNKARELGEYQGVKYLGPAIENTK